jgi:16S rRNA (cytosine1402-N4)-methyltransferase
MSDAAGHVPVLLHECVRLLAPSAGQTVLDCTAGRGGHALALSRTLGPRGRLLLVDLDAGNLAFAEARVKRELATEGVEGSVPQVIAIHASFAEVSRRLKSMGIQADVVLADLGFASNQMDDAARGLSFMRDGPLDMRLNPAAPITAAELVNSMSERELAELIDELGEDSNARRIARGIVKAREAGPITTTHELANVIRASVPKGPPSGIDPATKTFQAIRIMVNDELGSLDRLLASVARAASRREEPDGWLTSTARVGIISFHSLEDRRVKTTFGSLVRDGHVSAEGEQPTTASAIELEHNPRARSAKLRVVRLLVGAGAAR